MARIAEVKRIRLKGTDRMALEKYSATYMEFSYFKTSQGELDLNEVSWHEKFENSQEKRKEFNRPKE